MHQTSENVKISRYTILVRNPRYSPRDWRILSFIMLSHEFQLEETFLGELVNDLWELASGTRLERVRALRVVQPFFVVCKNAVLQFQFSSWSCVRFRVDLGMILTTWLKKIFIYHTVPCVLVGINFLGRNRECFVRTVPAPEICEYPRIVQSCRVCVACSSCTVIFFLFFVMIMIREYRACFILHSAWRWAHISKTSLI